MNTIIDVTNYYKDNNIDFSTKHKEIYHIFQQHAFTYNNGILAKHFYNTPGFGELSFFWSWFLLVNDMSNTFKFLEIGVYKGRILALIQLLSDLLKKKRIYIWNNAT